MTSGVRTVGTNLCKFKTPVLLFFRSSLAALISICGLSDPVKTLIESFVGGRSFHFVHFPIIEKNGIVKLEAGKYRNL